MTPHASRTVAAAAIPQWLTPDQAKSEVVVAQHGGPRVGSRIELRCNRRPQTGQRTSRRVVSFVVSDEVASVGVVEDSAEVGGDSLISV